MRKAKKKVEAKVDPVDQLMSVDKTLARRDMEGKLFKIRAKKA